MDEEKKSYADWEGYPTPGEVARFELELELKERAKDRLPFIVIAITINVGVIAYLILRFFLI